jgi:catechol 2,3-dioxygenase-like lactoylglutathione lyase family enzyme
MVQMIEGLEHVALEVQDAERSLRFYQDVFGAVETNHWESRSPGIRRIIFFSIGGAVIELIERGGERARFQDQGDAGIKHLCLRVRNLDAVMAMVDRLGVTVVSRAMTIDRSNYEPTLSDGSVDLDKGIRRAVVADPDGIQIELMEK